MRDVDGLNIQLVDPNTPSFIRSLKQESAVSITGRLQNRETPDGSQAWDLVVENAVVLNESSVVGSQLFTGQTKEWPPQYRYLQLRSPQYQQTIKRRAQIMKVCREVLDNLEFTEVDTPLLFKSTPEGAREFLVPTRKKGLMYALPQSPQQYKQLLMASGVHKYYQIAKCFRDEDLRQDRQPEFTQLDMEMSFSNGSDVQKVIEKVVKTIWNNVAQKTLYTFDKTDKKSLVPVSIEENSNSSVDGGYSELTRLTYDEAISRFGIDKPDIRSSLEIIDTTGYATAIEEPGFPVFEVLVIRNALDKTQGVPGLLKHLQDSQNYKAREPRVIPIKDDHTIQTWNEKFQGIAEFKNLEGLNNLLKLEPGDIIAGSTRAIKNYENPTPLGRLRTVAIQHTLPLGKYCREIKYLNEEKKNISDINKSVSNDEFASIWVVDFPLFNPVEIEIDNNNNNDNDTKITKYPSFDTTKYVSTHHPFTMANVDDYELLKDSPLEVRGQHYDLVMNGVELGGGSTRIHDVKLQQYIFDKILGIKNSKELFGHLLTAFDTGCPPHAGLAIGFDRMTAMLSNTDSIRDVIAFPKTITGADPMIGSPSISTKSQLLPYHIQVTD